MQKQKSILGFFKKQGSSPLQPQVNGTSKSRVTLPIGSPKKKSVSEISEAGQTLTPVPSSDALLNEDEDGEEVTARVQRKRAAFGLPSPVTPATAVANDASSVSLASSPTRKVCRD